MRRKRENEEEEDNLGLDATFPWSRTLTQPSWCNQTHNRVIQGRKGRMGWMVGILDWMSMFGFGFRDVIDSKVAHILLC